MASVVRIGVNHVESVIVQTLVGEGASYLLQMK